MSIIKPYKAISVNQVRSNNIAIPRENVQYFVGIDIAKYKHYAVLIRMDEKGQKIVEKPWIVKASEIETLVEVCTELNKYHSVQVGLESTGTYGDALRYRFTMAQIPIFQVRTKLVHDMNEFFDGCPSKHDGKDAQNIAQLLLEGKCSPWSYRTDPWYSELRGVMTEIQRKSHEFTRMTGQMEGLLGRYWPTYPNEAVSYSTATALNYFMEYGGPPEGSPTEIESTIRSSFKALHKEESLELLIESSEKPCGVPMTSFDREVVINLARDMKDAQERINELDHRLKELSLREQYIPNSWNQMLGKVVTCLIWVILGDPLQYTSAESLLKAMGLNLVEYSSGQFKGQVHISKRGNPLIRRYLYMAGLRLIQLEGIKEWYNRKKQGRKSINGKESGTSAIIAVVRKVLIGLYHSYKDGTEFNLSRLFRVNTSIKEESISPKVVKVCTPKSPKSNSVPQLLKEGTQVKKSAEVSKKIGRPKSRE